MSYLLGMALALLAAGGALALLLGGAICGNRACKRAGLLLLAPTLAAFCLCTATVAVKAYRRAADALPAGKSYRLAPEEATQALRNIIGNANFPKTAEIAGAWDNGIILSDGWFVYHAEPDATLAAVAGAPADPAYKLTPDAVCREAEWQTCRNERIDAAPELPEWNPAGGANRRCFTCLRPPWSHVLIFDPQTGTIYHYVTEIRD